VTGAVRTVLGDVPADQIGLTYAHEHLILDSPLVVDRFPDILLDDVDAAVAELNDCAAAGVGCVVDALPCGAGRDPIRLAEAGRRSGVHIIATTGLHTRKWYPGLSWANEADPDILAGLFTADLEDGMDRFDYRGPLIERTDHRAGLIKVGTSQDVFNARDRRVFAAAATAHAATGAPILTHCEEGRGGIEQVEALAGLGVEPAHVVLSHTDKVDDVGYHLDLAATGVNLEYDQALRHRIDEANPTVRLLAKLVEAGHVAQLMVGTDGARRSMWTAYGGAPGLAALAVEVVAVARRLGLDERAVAQILYLNPQRFLSFSEVVA
jgi:phosphotriesterase-related protein